MAGGRSKSKKRLPTKRRAFGLADLRWATGQPLCLGRGEKQQQRAAVPQRRRGRTSLAYAGGAARRAQWGGGWQSACEMPPRREFSGETDTSFLLRTHGGNYRISCTPRKRRCCCSASYGRWQPMGWIASQSRLVQEMNLSAFSVRMTLDCLASMNMAQISAISSLLISSLPFVTANTRAGVSSCPT
jgi:hypothetical protein